jgi:hypothetical protein
MNETKGTGMKPQDITLYSGGARGAEAAFGEAAAAIGAKEVNFTFEGHHIERSEHTIVLTDDELSGSDVVMEEVAKRLGRDYAKSPWMRRILQSIRHQVNSGYQIFIIGTIQSDGTVKGGTGWAAELGKMMNRPMSVYDQDKEDWFVWKNDAWVVAEPKIEHFAITGTGTRNLTDAGAKAIKDLFARSF